MTVAMDCRKDVDVDIDVLGGRSGSVVEAVLGGTLVLSTWYCVCTCHLGVVVTGVGVAKCWWE